jgi:predicted component of type VI protein secretion system
MSELALFLVRIAFVAVLWVFVLSLLSVIRADIYGRRVVSSIAKQNAPRLAATGRSAELGLEEPDETEATHVAMLTGKAAGSKIALDKRELVIGRAPNCDLPLTDEFASNMHAKLVKVGDDWVLQDLNSTNGTYLDGKRVTTPATVRLNTTIRIGATNFELRA